MRDLGRPCVFVLLLLVAACGEPEGDDVSVRWLDYEDFVSEVQPILAARCGNPSCHGRSDRAFSIYSQRNWRVDSEILYMPVELTTQELEHNFASSCVLVSEVEEPAHSLLLLKPLGDVAGTYHGGGTIFGDTSDRSYRILQDWIESGW